jgi:hypothetical protein
MFVANYMTTEPTTVPPTAGVAEARRLMTERGIGHLPVVDDDRMLLGLITERQMLSAPIGSQCGQIMSSHVVTIAKSAPLIAALRLSCEQRMSALPVVCDTRKLEGIITRGDLLCATYRLLGLHHAGSCIELALIDPIDDAIAALATLRENGIEPLSAVVGCVRDDGDEPALYIRVPQRTVRMAERALFQVGLVLLVPENQECTRLPTAAVAFGTDAVPGMWQRRYAGAGPGQQGAVQSG